MIGCIGALCDVALFLNLIGSMAFETVLGVGISTGLADTGFENHTCLFLQETNLWDLFTEVETKLVPILGGELAKPCYSVHPSIVLMPVLDHVCSLFNL